MVRSLGPDSSNVSSVLEDSPGMRFSMSGFVVCSSDLNVMRQGMLLSLNGRSEVVVPLDEHLVSPDGSSLAHEVGNSLVSSDHLEVHVVLHPLLSGGLGHLELSHVAEEGEVSEVVGSGTGGSSGEDSDLSEH